MDEHNLNPRTGMPVRRMADFYGGSSIGDSTYDFGAHPSGGQNPHAVRMIFCGIFAGWLVIMALFIFA